MAYNTITNSYPKDFNTKEHKKIETLYQALWSLKSFYPFILEVNSQLDQENINNNLHKNEYKKFLLHSSNIRTSREKGYEQQNTPSALNWIADILFTKTG